MNKESSNNYNKECLRDKSMPTAWGWHTVNSAHWEATY